MTAEALRGTLDDAEPPAGLTALVEAMWWQAHGDWERAHAIAQDIATPHAAWVHAYLHRCEGDLVNAGYWYRQVKRPMCSKSFAQEWAEIVDGLLDQT